MISSRANHMGKRCLSSFTPLLASGVVMTSAVLLGGCEGTIDDASGVPDKGAPNGPGGTPGGSDVGSPGGGAAGAGAGAGAGSSGVPGDVNASYTRLTRVEYQATIKAAYDVDAPVTGLPDDDRVGPFTSNVPSPTSVQLFM